MNDLISVIIPVYNVEEYLEKCLKSVIQQTYKELEIILVDDGSTDSSPDICDKFANEDDRISVVHKINGGLSSARNAGLDIAHGNWIAFLDSDDWIEPKMYEVLMETAKSYLADIATCKTRNCYLNETPADAIDSDEVRVFTVPQIIRGLFEQTVVRFEVWNKLWKKEVIGETRFVVGQTSEDVHFDRLVFLKANCMAYIDKTLHNYLVSRPGNTNSTFKYSRLCIFDEFDSFSRDVRDIDESLTTIIESIALKFSINIYDEACIKKIDKNTKMEIYQCFKKYYKKNALFTNDKYKRKARILSISPIVYEIIRKMSNSNREK